MKNLYEELDNKKQKYKIERDLNNQNKNNFFMWQDLYSELDTITSLYQIKWFLDKVLLTIINDGLNNEELFNMENNKITRELSFIFHDNRVIIKDKCFECDFPEYMSSNACEMFIEYLVNFMKLYKIGVVLKQKYNFKEAEMNIEIRADLNTIITAYYMELQRLEYLEQSEDTMIKELEQFKENNQEWLNKRRLRIKKTDN